VIPEQIVVIDVLIVEIVMVNSFFKLLLIVEFVENRDRRVSMYYLAALVVELNLVFVLIRKAAPLHCDTLESIFHLAGPVFLETTSITCSLHLVELVADQRLALLFLSKCDALLPIYLEGLNS
jgi:hypothetical protein